MAIQKNNKYLCGFCGKEFSKSDQADACKASHNIIYVPMTGAEISRLLNFIYLKEDKLIDESLLERLRKFMRKAAILDKDRGV